MGTDCKLLTEESKTSLDRWYVFSERFESGKEYNKKVFMRKLRNHLEFVIYNYINSFQEFADISLEDKQKKLLYFTQWIGKCFSNIGERNMIITEHDDRYCFTDKLE